MTRACDEEKVDTKGVIGFEHIFNEKPIPHFMYTEYFKMVMM